MKKILYIYGYGGSSKGNSFLTFKRLLPQYDVHCIDYNQTDCKIARKQLQEYIENEKIDLIISSSLGAFIALTLGNVPKVIVNPCIYPSVELPTIEVPQHLIDTYKPFEDMVLSPDEATKMKTYGFFSTHDELMGTKYVDAFKEVYPNIRFLENCGHRLTEEAISNEIIPLLPQLF